MGDNQGDRVERALHDAEVRLWVEQRELELLDEQAPAGAREDLEREIDRLRAAVERERARRTTLASPSRGDPAGGAGA